MVGGSVAGQNILRACARLVGISAPSRLCPLVKLFQRHLQFYFEVVMFPFILTLFCFVLEWYLNSKISHVHPYACLTVVNTGMTLWHLAKRCVD